MTTNARDCKSVEGCVDSERILAQDVTVSNNTRKTGLNNNDLIIGPSGAGKTRGYIKPNILSCEHSMVIADTKGNLVDEVGPVLKEKGYEILILDFKGDRTNFRYNPLDYIKRGAKNGSINEKKLVSMATALCMKLQSKDAFWDRMAEHYIKFVAAYILENNFAASIGKMVELANDLNTHTQEDDDSLDIHKMFDLKAEQSKDKKWSKYYDIIKENREVPGTDRCIWMNVLASIGPLYSEEMEKIYLHDNDVDLRELGKRKIALFLQISDTDRSVDQLVGLFYTQALHELCECADNEYSHTGNRLPVPVRFFFDDFATNCIIDNFDNIISVIRSREIYVSIVLQSIQQLDALYQSNKARVIIDNCDHIIYLGGSNEDTVNFIGRRTNTSAQKIYELPLSKSIVIERGKRGMVVDRYDITKHPEYSHLPEAKAKLNDQNIDREDIAR